MVKNCAASFSPKVLLCTTWPYLVCPLFLPPAAHTAAALLGGWAVGRYLGLDEVTSATYLVSSALCIAAIACLSQQSSARTGNALGLIGVSGGIVATLGGLNTDAGTYTQVGVWGWGLHAAVHCNVPRFFVELALVEVVCCSLIAVYGVCKSPARARSGGLERYVQGPCKRQMPGSNQG
jgi:NAD(P) transhydrogenase